MSLPHVPTVYIYGLCDPRTGHLRYIGKTNNLKNRLRQHSQNASVRSTHCYSWLKSLHRQNLEPEWFVIENCPETCWHEVERFWISYFRFTGCDLTNMTDGGDGVTHTPEIRAKMSASSKLRWPVCAGWNKGIKMSAEHCSKLSESHINSYKMKIMAKAKSAKMKGAPGFFTGKIHTAESRHQMSVAKKGRATKVSDYIVTPDGGEPFMIRNLAAFCRERALSRTAMLNVASGLSSAHKGWKIQRPK